MNFFSKTINESPSLISTPHPLPLCAGFTHIGKRPEQEDSYAISDWSNAELRQQRGVLLTLADGMGGLDNGKEVSELTVHALQETFLTQPIDATPDAWLLELLGEANRQVNDYLHGKADSGSTLVVALIQGDKLYHLSIGDSRLYLVRGGGMLLLNRDHSYGTKLDLLLLKQILPASVIASHPQRRALTAYMGMGDLKELDRTTVPLTLLKGDILLLLSDGVFNTLTEQEIYSALTEDPQVSATHIEQLVLDHQNPYQDNFTGIVYRHQGE